MAAREAMGNTAHGRTRGGKFISNQFKMFVPKRGLLWNKGTAKHRDNGVLAVNPTQPGQATYMRGLPGLGRRGGGRVRGPLYQYRGKRAAGARAGQGARTTVAG